MNFQDIFASELSSNDTRYFIFDSKGDDQHGDKEFLEYHWSTDKFSKVREGDVFLYRRPANSSETGKFYFYGAGRISSIVSKSDKKDDHRVIGLVTKATPFNEYIYQDQLINHLWSFKNRTRNDWLYFFNQYGMTEIFKDDFLSIGVYGESDIPLDESEESVNLIKQIKNHNYGVEDSYSEAKKRVGHTVFSNKVKANYKHTCAMCSINTPSFLIGSHVVPWADNKNIRLDPQNGICLCVIHDKAFDKGYVTIDDNYKIILSKELYSEVSKPLFEVLKIKGDQKLKMPKNKDSIPKKEYLQYHREHVFEKFKK